MRVMTTPSTCVHRGWSSRRLGAARWRPATADAWAHGVMDPEVEGWFAHRATFSHVAGVAIDVA